MLDPKKLALSSKFVKKMISEGLITSPIKGTDAFFMEKSLNSIAVANRLTEIDEKEGLNTRLWVINASYYSMFFAATAILAKSGHKLNIESGIHKATYHALVHFFINEENKLKKYFAEEYINAVNEAEELLQISEQRIGTLIADFDYELEKRKRITYALGEIAEKNKAKTSLARAKSFVKEIEKIINHETYE